MQALSFSNYFFKTVGRQLRWNSTLSVGAQTTVMRKITQEDIDKFIELSGDNNSVHTTSQKPLVHGAFLNSLVSGVIGTKLPGFGSIVLEQTLKFPAPCYIGDEVVIHVVLTRILKTRLNVEYQVSVIEENRKRCCLKGTALLYLPPTKAE